MILTPDDRRNLERAEAQPEEHAAFVGYLEKTARFSTRGPVEAEWRAGHERLQVGSRRPVRIKSVSSKKRSGRKVADAVVGEALGRQFVVDLNALTEAIDSYAVSVRAAVTRADGSPNKSSVEQLKGFVAEAHHQTTFNINARARRIPESKLRAELGRYGDPETDILVRSANGDRAYQSKYCRTAKASANDLSQLKAGNAKYQAGKVAPSDQVDGIRGFSSRKAATEAGKRPAVSNAHQHTADHVEATIRDSKSTVESDPLALKESRRLTKEAMAGRDAEYSARSKKQNELFRGAMTKAALVGAATAAVTSTVREIVCLCREGGALSAEDFGAALQRILGDAADGGARAVTLVAGQRIAATGARSTIARASVVTVVANVAYDLGKDLYRFAKGEMTSDELLSSTLANGLATAGGVAGATAGASIASAIGWGATIGTPLGPLGVIVGGVIGGLAVGLGVGKFIGAAQQEGIEALKADLARLETAGATQGALQYIDAVGEMSEYRFSFKHLIPCYGTLGALSEYSSRKKVLAQIESQLSDRSQQVSNAKREHLASIEKQYKLACRRLETEFSVQRDLRLAANSEYRAQLQEQVDGFVQAHALTTAVAKEQTVDRLIQVSAEVDLQRAERARLKQIRSVVKSLAGTLDLIKDEADREELRETLSRIAKGSLLGDFESPLRKADRFFGLRAD